MHAAHASTVLRFAGKERAATELDDIDQLVHRYGARLLRFVAFSIGDQDLAQSIVQDCFMKAYNARDNFRGDCSVQTWLNRIALITEIASTLPSRASTPEKDLLRQERAAQVAKALESLSFNQRTIFLMHFQEGMNIPEISSAIDMSVNTVKTHLHRAVKAVRQKIGEMK
jgi:RNA polymerase sigma-70 factor (ECF subfamily)